MSSFEQFRGTVSSSVDGGDFGRGNVAMKHLNRSDNPLVFIVIPIISFFEPFL